MELKWWSEETIFVFVQQEANYCTNNCTQINRCLETFPVRAAPQHKKGFMRVSVKDGGSVYQVEQHSVNCHASQKCPCGDGWVGKWDRCKERWTDE